MTGRSGALHQPSEATVLAARVPFACAPETARQRGLSATPCSPPGSTTAVLSRSQVPSRAVRSRRKWLRRDGVSG